MTPEEKAWQQNGAQLTASGGSVQTKDEIHLWAEGSDFRKKITYKATGELPKALIAQFRNSCNPLIAVTVDMVATGTDIKPLENVFFKRSVASEKFFVQVKVRGGFGMANSASDARKSGQPPKKDLIVSRVMHVTVSRPECALYLKLLDTFRKKPRPRPRPLSEINRRAGLSKMLKSCYAASFCEASTSVLVRPTW